MRIALITALFALALAPAASAARGDVQLLANVPSPGFPASAYPHPNGHIYVGTYINPQGSSQRSRVLEYAEKLREPDTSAVEDAAHAVPIFDVVREDKPHTWLSAEEALSNAPRQANGLFIVPKVVE